MGKEVKDVVDAEPPFRLFAGHHLRQGDDVHNHGDQTMVVVSQMNLVIMTMVVVVNSVILMAKTWRASSGAESGPFLTSGLADSRGSELQWQCL